MADKILSMAININASLSVKSVFEFSIAASLTAKFRKTLLKEFLDKEVR